MQTINDLPLESIEHIIDYLHDNPGALQASSLTARSWTDVSQKHLHHCVKFYSGAGRIHDPEAYTSRNVARRVKKLVLSYTPPPTSRTLTAKNIWAIISRLADVTILEMTDFSWTSCTPEMWDIVANTMGRSVNHLIIHTATFQHVQDLLYFLSAFPHLTNLSLSHIEWRESGGAPQETLELSPGRLLRHLRLDWFGSNRVVQDLLDAWVSSFPETLQEAVLGFQWYSFAGIGPLSPYLHAIGPVLAHLKLSLNDCDDGIFRAPSLQLERCTELKTIEFVALCDIFQHSNWGYHDDWRGDNNWVPDMLSQVRSHHLTDVVLRLNARTVEDLVLLDFASVDQVLQDTQFKQTRLTVALSRLYLGRDATEASKPVVAELERKLPHILKREMLVFEMSD